MKFQSAYQPKNQQVVEDFINEMEYALLMTQNKDKVFRTGMINPYYADGKFYLHLHHADNHVPDIIETNRATLVYQEFLTTIKSYWMDPKYGGMASMCYRYAEFHCQTTIIDDIQQKTDILARMLTHYQPEGGYDPVVTDNKVYQAAINALVVVELQPQETNNKWKLAQPYPKSRRLKLIEHLEQRGEHNDVRTAELIRQTL